MDNLKTFTVQFKHGIHDLTQEVAYTGSWGQGDHYASNEIGGHPDYVSYNFGDVPQTREAIDAEIRRRKLKNLAYIAELKASGKYGTTYDINVSYMPHPLFDGNQLDTPSLMTSKILYV